MPKFAHLRHCLDPDVPEKTQKATFASLPRPSRSWKDSKRHICVIAWTQSFPKRLKLAHLRHCLDPDVPEKSQNVSNFIQPPSPPPKSKFWKLFPILSTICHPRHPSDPNKMIIRKVADLMWYHNHSAQNFALVLSSMVLENVLINLWGFGWGGGLFKNGERR